MTPSASPAEKVYTSNDISLEYLAEGAANIIYRILPPRLPTPNMSLDPHTTIHPAVSQTVPPIFHNKLVRLRKTSAPSATLPLDQSLRHFEDVIQPLFAPDNLVRMTRFHFSQDLLDQLDTDLERLEILGRRAQKRCGTYLHKEEGGLLVTDMTCASGDASRLIEFKPKWLAQSPSAPEGSRRCRTCALRAMRIAKRQVMAVRSFCPLDLVSRDPERIRVAVDSILGEGVSDVETLLQEQLTRFLCESDLLHRLRQLQIDFDPDGPSEERGPNSSLGTAMTLRDCTLFLKVSRDKVFSLIEHEVQC